MSKQLIGNVVSIAGDKSIVVSVQAHKTHPLYHKAYINTKKYLVHDEKNQAKIGDRVAIKECAPLSARKHFKLTEIIEQQALSKEDLSVLMPDETKKKADEELDNTEKNNDTARK
jgi:small subunit ribosomal protein S17